MLEAFSLEEALHPVKQAVVATDGSVILFANRSALSAFGQEIKGRPAEEFFTQEILKNSSDFFAASTTVNGRGAKLTVSRRQGISLIYVDFEPVAANNIAFTRRMFSNLRNCATGIKLAADHCFGRIESGQEPTDRAVSILYHYYYRLARTIIQLDSADKLDRGEIVFTPVATDIGSFCASLIDTVSSLCHDSGVKLRYNFPAELVLSNVDVDLFELTMYNLLSNSLKNAGVGTVIELSVKSSQNKTVISLDDNGVGIPDKKLGDIFSIPTDSDSTSPDDEIGLGLYIAHSVVRLHDGTMLVESREGSGVHIRILLPSAEDSGTSLNASEEEYLAAGMSPALTGLADVLPSGCYGTKFED